MIDESSRIGHKYGMLTCIEFLFKIKGRYLYNFRCDCGKIVKKEYAEVKRKRYGDPSCGCSKRNLINWQSRIGERSGSVELIEFIGKSKNNQHFKYKCDCGNIRQTSYQNFLRLDSCGCKRNFLKPGQVIKNYLVLSQEKENKTKVKCLKCKTIRSIKTEAVKNKNTENCTCITAYNKGITISQEDRDLYKRYRQYESTAKIKRNNEFDITFDDFKHLVNSNCHYCGDRPSNENFKRIGLDRINSNIGYFRENVVPCCYKCNIMKNDLTVEEFKTHIEKIYKGFNK